MKKAANGEEEHWTDFLKVLDFYKFLPLRFLMG